MITISFMQALVGVGSLGAMLVAFYGPWQWISTDIARQFVFEKRDAIFDIAMAGGLDFDSREYATIRSTLQANIRFAHDLTLPRFVILGLLFWMRGELPNRDGVVALDRAIVRIRDPATRAEVQKLIDEVFKTLLVMIFLKSLWVLLLFPLTILAIVAAAICHDAARVIFRVASRVIQVEAESAPQGRAAAA